MSHNLDKMPSKPLTYEVVFGYDVSVPFRVGATNDFAEARRWVGHADDVCANVRDRPEYIAISNVLTGKSIYYRRMGSEMMNPIWFEDTGML